MKIYADTNFFTYLYLEDQGSGAAESLVQRNLPLLPVTWLMRLEIINAFEQVVLTGFGTASARVSAELAAACQQQFREDLAQGMALREVEVGQRNVAERFEEIALRHTSRHGFRTYDILHVASALCLGCGQFWSFDKKASRLAALEGLETLG